MALIGETVVGETPLTDEDLQESRLPLVGRAVAPHYSMGGACAPILRAGHACGMWETWKSRCLVRFCAPRSRKTLREILEQAGALSTPADIRT